MRSRIKSIAISNVSIVIIILCFIVTLNSNAQETLRIMPLGNSITYDTYEGDTRSTGDKIGYRYKLYQLLNQAGYNFQYVGNRMAGWNYFGNFEDSRNAGWPGIRDDDLADIIETGTSDFSGRITPGPYLETYPADLIILHIGTNDVWAGDYNSVWDVNRLLDAVDDYEASSGNPVLVLLARIISFQNYTCNTHNGVKTYNSNLVSMATNRINSGDNIIMVDMECGADINYYTDMNDLVHPLQSGYDKMGQEWFDRIDAINTSPVVNNIPDQQINEGSYFNTVYLDWYVSDVENTDAEIIWTISPEDPIYLDITIDSDRIATVTPKDSNWYGTETVTFIATDRGKIIEGLRKSDSENVVFTVNPVNDPPLIISQKIPLSTPEETSLEISISHLNVEDVDNDTSELTLTVKAGNNYTFSGNVITPATDFNGTLNVNVMVSDLEYDSEIFSMNVEVTPNNDKPIIVSQSLIEVLEEGSVELLLTHLNVTDPDNEYPDEHTLIVMDGTNYSHNGNIITPDADFDGSLTVPVKVRDQLYESDIFNLTIDVLPVNDAPQFTSIPNTYAEEGADYEYYFTAEDPEDEVLAFSAVKIPLWLDVSFYDSYGLLLGQPGYDDSGQDTVILKVTDSEAAFAEQMFIINIKNMTGLLENKAKPAGLVYPNPADNYIKIKLDEDPGSAGIFQLFNVFGKEMISESVYSYLENIINLDRQHILPGIYFYRITCANNSIKEGKIIILDN